MSPIIPNTYLRRISLLVWCALNVVLTVGDPSLATAQEQEHCATWVGKVVSAEGTLEANRVSTTTWQPTKVGATFCPGDKLRVETWRAAIVLSNETIIRLDQGTTITFTKIEERETSWLKIIEGIVHFISRVPQNLTIETPFVNATVEGTEFVIRVDRGDTNETNVWVLEGTVLVSNLLGEIRAKDGDAVVTPDGKAPKRRLDIKPRDAVQWALYYPPLLDVSPGSVTGPNKAILQTALGVYQKGHIRRALDNLNIIPLEQRDTQFLGIRAGLLLSVGQRDEANMDIEKALRLEPSNGTALALKSVIALANNDKEQALQLAKQAVASSPQSSVGFVALSYAQQANFDIEQALISAQQATRHSPKDALAWARVAELQLSSGYLSEAHEAAQQAAELNPELERTQTILGFALLMEAKISDARFTFEKAIKLNPSAPLPHLGLGLTKIQKSDLTEGRQEIEIAAILDLNNSLIRSYWGKAYFEDKWDPDPSKELALANSPNKSTQKPRKGFTIADLHNDTKQNGEAAKQLQRAKDLDAKDPTAYFYDAIRKQSINRPIEALTDLQKSIELNDNRAVYRSKLLLDDDKAARSASLGRIYQDLGFHARARVEGWDSLNSAPENYSAHRLLADSYAKQPRLEIARVSELLQSQLLQPVNINNLQPQLSETSLQILEGTGPASGGFNEFNPIFFRDRLALLGNVAIGSQDTLSNNVVLSGMLADPVSISLGQFHYETDGYRKNNDNNINIYNLFAQGEITPKINLQGEYRYKKTKRGDLLRNFDPSDFSMNFREKFTQETTRLGARFSPASHSDVLLSLIYSKLESEANFGTIPSLSVQLKDTGYQGEGQYVFRHSRFNAILGGGKIKVDRESTVETGPIALPFPPFLIPGRMINTKPDANFDNIYLYFNANFPSNVTWTGGLNYTHVKEKGIDLDVGRVLPKAGVQWDITDWARLRFTYLQTMKSPAVVEQTIEPTQISGFNQLFLNATNGSKSTGYGIALDTKPSDILYGGIKIFYREFDQPSIFPLTGALKNFHYRGTLYHAYLYWTPNRYWSVSSDVELEKVYRPSNIAAGMFGDGNFTQLDTLIVPISVKFFHPSGFFVGLTGTYLTQDLTLPSTATFKQDNEKVLLLNVSMGYRFPKRRGVLTAEIQNITDQNYSFQNPNTLNPTVGNQRFAAELTGVVKLIIALSD